MINNQTKPYNKYGYFSEKEFVIVRPDTPRPWMNYIGNAEYCVRFSQTGGGDSFHRFPRINNITYTHYDDTPEFFDDRPGRWVYIMDAKTGKFWSLNWQPVMAPYEEYECRHGMGYSVLRNKSNGIEASMRVFVPLNGTAEIWSIDIENQRDEVVDLQIFPFIEWFITDDIYKAGFFCGNHVEYYPEHSMAYSWYSKKQLEKQKYAAFMVADFEPDGCELSRRNFLGVYGTYQHPRAILEDKFTSSRVDYEPSVTVFKKNIQLKPQERFKFQITIGVVDSKDQALATAAGYSKQIVETEFAKVKQYWDQRLSTALVKTPDAEFDHFTNTWFKHQVHHTSFWIRPGGDKGFRDVCQDAENILAFDAPRCKTLLLEAMRYQYSNGKSVRQWPQHPTGQIDNRDYRDSPVWLTYSVCEYIKETGDLDFHKIEVPYLDKGSANVWGHVKKAIENLYTDRGEHGLSHIGCGDWNDGFDEVGIEGNGESVWLTMALTRALVEVAQLADFIGENETARQYEKRASELKMIINSVAWDGRWYTRAINDNGIVLGSHKCDQGKIFLLPQAWAMLSGISESWQNEKMIAAITEMMMTDFGPIKIAPTYTKYQKGIGKIAYRPGFSEAGAVYIHAATFLIAGLCEIGEGHFAWDILTRILPTNPKNPPEVSWSEPYALSNFYMGPQTVCPGRSLYGWLTASGGWAFKNGLSRICGIKPCYEGLDIRPAIPAHWNEISVDRKFRGAEFQIQIRRDPKKIVKIDDREAQLPIRNIKAGKKYRVEIAI